MAYNPITTILTEVPGVLNLPQTVTPSSLPASGFDFLYFKADNNLYRMTSTGSESQVGGGGGGSPAGANGSLQYNNSGAFGGFGNWNGSILAITGGLTISGVFQSAQQLTPSNPPSGSNDLYFKADDNLYMLNSAGVETQVNGGGGGGANQSLSNLTNPTAINQDLIIPSNKLFIGPLPSDGNLQAAVQTDIGFDGPTILLIRGLDSGSNSYSGMYFGNDSTEVALNVFVNSSTRGVDGPPNSATIRMENNGSLRIKANGGLTLEGAVSFPDGINDNSNNPSIDVDGRALLDDGDNFSVDWENRQLTDSGGDIVIDWQNRSISGGNGTVVWNIDLGRFLDDTGTRSININTRIAQDSGQTDSVNWDGRTLHNNAGTLSLDWDGKDLYNDNDVLVASWAIGFTPSLLAFDRNIITTQSNFTIADNITWVILNPPGVTGAQTITMPGTPVAGQTIIITAPFNGVAALTLAPSGGQSIQGTLPTSIDADSPIRYVYDSGFGAWMKW